MKKMVRCMITLILAVGRSMKWMMTLNLCLMPLNKILEINYTSYHFFHSIASRILSPIVLATS